MRPMLSSFRISSFVDSVLIDPQLPAEILADQQDSEANESGVVQGTGPTPTSGPQPLTTNNCSPSDQNHLGWFSVFVLSFNFFSFFCFFFFHDGCVM